MILTATGLIYATLIAFVLLSGLLVLWRRRADDLDAYTEPTRTMAIAADLELRRRHPDTQLESLSGAEPGQAATSPGDAEWIWQAFTVTGTAGKVPDQEGQDLDFELIPSRSAEASRLPDLAELDIDADVADRLARIADRASQAQQQLDCLAAMPEFADEEQSFYTRPAWDLLARRQRDAILQPPKPEITPASPVLELARTAAAQADFEAEPG